MAINVCRFSPEHVFPNPVALRRHYEQEHADVWTPPYNPKVRCVVNECGKVQRLSNVHSHMMREHGNRTTVGSYVEVDEETPLTPRIYSNATKKLNGTTHKETMDGKLKAKFTINRCDICGWETKRGNMGKHFLTHHNENYPHWRSYVSDVDAPTKAVEVAEVPELVTTLEPSFAVHEDGHGYMVDDFWLPVVHQLAKPDGVVPVEAMAALGAFRDDVGRMLHAVTHLPPRRKR